MTEAPKCLKLSAAVLAAAGIMASASATRAQMVLAAPKVDTAISLDGKTDEWSRIPGITVPMKGQGKVDSVEIKAAIYGGRIYVFAKWADSEEGRLHKPYKWDEAGKSYKRTKIAEDRFAVTFEMSGNFSANKLDGSEFTADVWHWKASRSDPVGVAHDKIWKVSSKPFKKGKKFKTPDGKTVYLARSSDAGDRLYRAVKYDVKQKDVMPRYKLTQNPKGSIADVSAKGVWRDGYWYLELSRKLDTGNADDAVIPADGSIKMAIAAFNGVGGKRHSVSEIIILKTGAKSSS